MVWCKFEFHKFPLLNHTRYKRRLNFILSYYSFTHLHCISDKSTILKFTSWWKWTLLCEIHFVKRKKIQYRKLKQKKESSTQFIRKEYLFPCSHFVFIYKFICLAGQISIKGNESKGKKKAVTTNNNNNSMGYQTILIGRIDLIWNEVNVVLFRIFFFFTLRKSFITFIQPGQSEEESTLFFLSKI